MFRVKLSQTVIDNMRPLGKRPKIIIKKMLGGMLVKRHDSYFALNKKIDIIIICMLLGMWVRISILFICQKIRETCMFLIFKRKLIFAYSFLYFEYVQNFEDTLTL